MNFHCYSFRLATMCADRGMKLVRHANPIHAGSSVWHISVYTQDDLNFIKSFFDAQKKGYPKSLQHVIREFEAGVR